MKKMFAAAHFTVLGTTPAPSNKSIKTMAGYGVISIHHAGYGPFGTDSWWRQKKLHVVREYCKRVRDTGLLVAVTSHRPEAFMEIESQDWDVDYYMTCLYKSTTFRNS